MIHSSESKQLSEIGEIKPLLAIKKYVLAIYHREGEDSRGLSIGKPPAGNLGWYFSLPFLVDHIEKEQHYNVLRYITLKQQPLHNIYASS